MSERQTLKNLTLQIEEDSDNPILYSLRADQYFNNEEYKKAIEDLSKAISLTSEDDLEKKAAYLTDRGENYLNLGDSASAIADFTSCILIEEIPSFLLHRTYNLRGDVNNSLGELHKAKDDFTKAIELAKGVPLNSYSPEEKEGHRSNLATYHYNRGRTRVFLSETEDLTLSLIDFEVAISLYTDDNSRMVCFKEKCKVHEKLRENGEGVDGYLEDLTSIIENSEPEDAHPFLVKRAELFLDKESNGNFFIKDIEALLSENKHKLTIPEKESLFFVRSKIYYWKRKYKKSLYDITYVIGLSTKVLPEKRVEHLDFRAEIFLEMKKDNPAILDYREIIKILRKKKGKGWRVKCHGFRRKIGSILFRQKKYSKALEEYIYHFDQLKPSRLFKQRNILRTTYTRSVLLFGSSLKRVAMNDGSLKKVCLKLAETVFTKLIVKSGQLDNTDQLWRVNFFYHRGDIFSKLENFGNAIDDFSYVIKNDPGFSDGICFFERGECYRKIKNKELMSKDFLQYLQYNKPYIVDTFDDLSETQHDVYTSLSEFYVEKKDLFLSEYYVHLNNSTLSCNLEELDDEYLGFPDHFVDNRHLKGDLYVPKVENRSDESRFVVVGLFMAYTALYHLNDPEKMFEIVIYLLIMKQDVFGVLSKIQLKSLISNHFFQVDDINQLERLEFIIDSGIFSSSSDRKVEDEEEEEEEGETDEDDDSTAINVFWKSCDQNIFIKKYFLMTFLKKYKDAGNTFELSEKVPRIDPLIIYKCLFGILLSDKELFDNIFNLFLFFKDLHLYGHIQALCFAVTRLSLKEKLILFNRSISRFEKKTGLNFIQSNDDDENEEELIEMMIDGKVSGNEIDTLSFNSPISLSLFKELQIEIDEIKENKSYIQVLDRLGYFTKLQHSKSIEINNHSFFENLDEDDGIINDICDYDTYYREYFEKFVLYDIYKSKRYTSHTLTTKDGSSFSVHKEILILRSNFFYQMFKFPGRESSNKVIVIEDLSGDSLKTLLDSVYFKDYSSFLKNLNNSSLAKSLFELLVHSEMYQNILLKSRIITAIDDLFEEYSEDDILILKILEHGKYLEKMPQWYRDLMLLRWNSLSKLSFGELNNIINHSIKTEQLANSSRVENMGSSGTVKRKDRSGVDVGPFLIPDSIGEDDQPVKKKRKTD